MVLFTVLYKVVLTFESADEIQKCDHSNQSFSAVIFRGAAFSLFQMKIYFYLCFILFISPHTLLHMKNRK